MQTLPQTVSNYSASIASSLHPPKAALSRQAGSKLIHRGPATVFEFGASYIAETEYVTPESVADPDTEWISENNTIDGFTATAGFDLVDDGYLSGPLDFTFASSLCLSGCRVWVGCLTIDPIPCWVWYWTGSAWVFIVQQACACDGWVDIIFPTLVYTNKLRLELNNNSEDTATMRVYEFQAIRRIPLDVSLYDGFSTAYEKKARIILSSTGGTLQRFGPGLWCDKGLYLSFAEPVADCFVRYIGERGPRA